MPLFRTFWVNASEVTMWAEAKAPRTSNFQASWVKREMKAYGNLFQMWNVWSELIAQLDRTSVKSKGTVFGVSWAGGDAASVIEARRTLISDGSSISCSRNLLFDLNDKSIGSCCSSLNVSFCSGLGVRDICGSGSMKYSGGVREDSADDESEWWRLNGRNGDIGFIELFRLFIWRPIAGLM